MSTTNKNKYPDLLLNLLSLVNKTDKRKNISIKIRKTFLYIQVFI